MTVHLVCNAHLDPAWLWEIDEGAAEVLSTFRIAADFCEEYDGFVFNHNEAILYEWVKEFDAGLFARIQRLVREGRWHIMGGWFLQPDCNMPSGESFVRQILIGRQFFSQHFDVEPSTAINFDPFGHTRGLVQIMARSGYTSYIHCRPGPEDLTLPGEYYRWIGYDGSSVVVARKADMYISHVGAAVEKTRATMEREADHDPVLVLWGIGNHGGGPSREDLRMIAAFQQESSERGDSILHSTPERFFGDLAASGRELPEWTNDLNPWAPGCYTSQIRIKQKHRRLENDLYATERLAVHAGLLELAEYPRQEIAAAQYDLLTSEFHDILPGSSIRPVEEASLRLLDHGLEILSRARRRLFFALAATMPAPEADTIPIIAYHSGARPADGVWECEFQPPRQNWESTFTDYEVVHDGKVVPSQIEHEASSLTLDWRKKIVFRATLPAASMTRFVCRPVIRQSRPVPTLTARDGRLVMANESMRLAVSASTGLVDEFVVNGVSLVRPGAFQPIVVADDEDAWGSMVRRYRDQVGAFTLMSAERSAAYSGFDGTTLPAVRVIEEGAVRTIVEALFQYGDSACILRYKVPRAGASFDLEVEVNWREKNRMLKLAIPTTLDGTKLLGQVAFGVQELPANGDELVTQRWQAVVGQATEHAGERFALGMIDDGVYGSDFSDGELRISLVHAPVYSALRLGERPIVSADRHNPRIDQGERFFSFRVVADRADDLVSRLGTLAAAFNERPYFLSLFTRGDGVPLAAGLTLDDDAVLCSALKAAEDGEPELIARLFNTTDVRRTGVADLAGRASIDYDLGPYEVRTYRGTAAGRWRECSIIERELP